MWAGGSILMDSTTDIGGDAKASAPTGTTCNAASTSYQITGRRRRRDRDRMRPGHGDRRQRPGGHRAPRRPPSRRCRPYTFAPINYPGIDCYGGVGRLHRGEHLGDRRELVQHVQEPERDVDVGRLRDLADLPVDQRRSSTSSDITLSRRPDDRHERADRLRQHGDDRADGRRDRRRAGGRLDLHPARGVVVHDERRRLLDLLAELDRVRERRRRRPVRRDRRRSSTRPARWP